MKAKFLMVLFVAFLFSVALASATSSFSVSSSSVSLNKGTNSTTINLIANASVGNVTVTFPSTLSMGDGTNNVSVSIAGSTLVVNGSTNPLTITTTSIPSALKLGSYSSSFLISNASNPADNKTVAVTFVNGFCDYGEKGNARRSLEIKSLSDESSDDEWEWKPLDKVEIEVEVEFNGEDRDDEADIVVELGLYDTQEDEFLDLGEDDILEKDLTLEDGDDGTVTFTIEVPLDVESDTSGRYKLFVKAYEEGDEDTLCTDKVDSNYYQEVDIKKKNYDVVLKEISATETVPCGAEVLLIANVYNIGKNDEDKVYVNAYNKELGLNMNSRIFSLDEGDKEVVSFSFIIPKNATEKKYVIDFTTYFKYSASSDTFREHSTEDFEATFFVEGNCINVSAATATINVEYSDKTPKAIIGKDVTIVATLKNTGASTATYVLSIPSVSWAKVSSITPSTLTLAAGESGTSEITLSIYENATAGNKEFTIKATSGATTLEQKVQMTLEKGFSWNALEKHFKDNWFIYAIVLVNVILLVIIIVTIVKVSKKRSA